jgi:hypothetical protein
MIRLAKYVWRERPNDKRYGRPRRWNSRNRWGLPAIDVKRPR